MLSQQLDLLDLTAQRMPAIVHDFKQSLAKSHEASDLPLWNELYKQFFPGFQGSTDLRHDGLHQRQGIDRLVHFHNGVCLKTVKIDEKARSFVKESWYLKPFTFDIAIEFYSDFDRKIPGWVNKPLDADYIAYAVLPIGQAVLLPVVQLQKAWANYSTQWLSKFFIAKAQNKGYSTHCVCVPLSVVFSAIGANFRANFKPVTEEP